MKKKLILIGLGLAAILAALLFLDRRGAFAPEAPVGHERFLEYPVVIDVDDTLLHVALANSEEQRDLHLSRVPSLEWDQGMLVAFDSADVHEIDIAGVQFPIDILWLDESRSILGSDKNLQAGLFTRSAKAPSRWTKYAVLVSGGWIEAHGIYRNTVVLSEDPALPQFATRDLRSDEEKQQAAPPEPIVLSGELPGSIVHDVPFVPQAPFGDWNDIRQANACEEASALMAVRWMRGEGIGRREAEDLFLAMWDWQEERYGNVLDTSVADTADWIIRDYLGYEQVSVQYGITVNDIRRELASGNLVIVPTDGRRLNNPYYSPPGPEVHMLVVIGYDDAQQQFITNDPGTRNGASLRYTYADLIDAVADYPSGYLEPSPRNVRAMIIVSPAG